ncbi:MAG: repair protein RecN [Bacteroidota bacterium]|jgi:DNA repair protein RecN (Recombination protein N)
MLKQLDISNFAIIQQLSLTLDNGLIALTGETGAGKSILLGAMQLLLGARADTQSLLDKSAKCSVEGSFTDFDAAEVNKRLVEFDIDILDNHEIILRREISASGRSRAFVNDTPVNIAQLESIAQLLVDIHRQFDTIELKDKHKQLQIIDAIGNCAAEKANFAEGYEQLKLAQQALNTLKQEKASLLKEYEYNAFLLKELDDINLDKVDAIEIERNINLLNNAEALSQALQQSTSDLLTREHSNAIAIVKQCLQKLEAFQNMSESLADVVPRLKTVYIELKDLAAEIESLSETIVYDEQRLDELNALQHTLNKLLLKHNSTSVTDLLAIREELAAKVLVANNIDEHIAAAEKKVQVVTADCTTKAKTLSAKRIKTIASLQKALLSKLKQVGLANMHVEVQCKSVALCESGIDDIAILVDANGTGKMQEISKVASGGELSRLMLCLKSLMADAAALPTLIFDEIDTGISGEVALQVGRMMQDLAKKHQIITVTHLPQIASKAKQHWHIYKQASDKGTLHTQVQELSGDARLNKIAEMISGAEVTQSALTTAIELSKN